MRMAKMGRPKAEVIKDKQIGIRMTAEEYDRLKRYAEQCNQTISEIVKELLEKHCFGEGNDK